MRISVPGRSKRWRGFTLIEMLVVMVIIALGASLAALSIGQTAHQRVRDEARTLGSFFRRVANEASARGQTLVMKQSGTYWAVAARPREGVPGNATAVPLPVVHLESDVVSVLVEDTPLPSGGALLFPPGGNGPAFVMTLRHRDTVFEVRRDALGRISVRESS